MSAPDVSALVELTYRSAVDDPSRFGKSGTVGANFGLTPKKYQSGETDRNGCVRKVGDGMVRTVLFEAAHNMLTLAVWVKFGAGRKRPLLLKSRRPGRRPGKVVRNAVNATADHPSETDLRA
jgi:transposase